jgi:hypothetical protein
MVTIVLRWSGVALVAAALALGAANVLGLLGLRVDFLDGSFHPWRAPWFWSASYCSCSRSRRVCAPTYLSIRRATCQDVFSPG